MVIVLDVHRFKKRLDVRTYTPKQTIRSYIMHVRTGRYVYATLEIPLPRHTHLKS